ncbi:oligopeptidase B [Woeseia oceani]|uniref:Oligopeptidase B n=2 Tax=Woeseia oceani TaxID=1548547 RepID=A0A193LFH8_9GAMM|nr:oligopeptidase B [Woeseia oceani]
MRISPAICAAFIVVLAACSSNTSEVPMPEKIPHTLNIHGDERVDDYFWMNDREDPRVIDWLNKQNEWTEKRMEPMQGLKASLFDEMRSRIKEEDSSAPYKDGDYWYYYRYEEGHEYPVYCRKRGQLTAPEEVLLDVNGLVGEHEYFAVRNFAVSPDHKLAAYGVDTQGRRFYTIYFLDLETGRLLDDRITDVTSNFEWANDSKTLLYSVQDSETLRMDRVYRHVLGEPKDTLVYAEPDDTNWLWVEKSLSSRMFYLVSAATVSTEVRYLPADTPLAEPRLFLPREPDHEYFVTDGVDRFFVLSNDNARNFRVFEVPLDNTARDQWQEIVPHREDTLIEGFDIFKDYAVLSLLENGVVQLEVMPRGAGETYRIPFDEDVFTAYSDDNVQYDTHWFRYGYESMTTPESVYDFNLQTREQKLVKEDTVLGGFDRANYESKAIVVPARDGASIPVSMVYRKGIKLDGTNPLLQYGYGSYGVTIDPSFNSDRLSLLDRGFIFAVAHIRGSSKLGREWYYEGRQLKKMNTFNDFIDVSRYLIDQGYTSPEHLYARGGSAGGLLMGAVVNMAPELYKGISAAVPFVDVVTTMLDDSIPLTSGEWDEWGNPNEKEFYEYMLSYSPYDNVERKDYPNMLVTTGLHDSQVQYWEPAKWVAKLNEYKTDDNMLLLKTDMQAGHSGKTGRFQSLEDTALYYSFFLWLEGIRE